MYLYCPRDNGRIFIERALCNNGEIALSCIQCSNRWDLEKNTFEAKVFTRIERLRILGQTHTSNVLPQQRAS